MNKIKIICALILILTIFSTALLTSCGKSEEFVEVSVVTTLPQVTEEESFAYRELDVFGTKMGMSIEDTQKALNVPVEIYLSDKGLYYFVTPKNDVPFVNADQSTNVFFIFGEKARLCEVQYVSTEQTGFVLNDAIAAYDSQYGRHVEVASDAGKNNFVWYKDGVYIVITTVSDGQNAMSFFDKDYFEKNYQQEANAYNAK